MTPTTKLLRREYRLITTSTMERADDWPTSLKQYARMVPEGLEWLERKKT